MSDPDPQRLLAPLTPVSRETATNLLAYVALLRRWQSTINLIAPSTLEHLWDRHIFDSAQLLPLLPESLSPARPLIDLGSGAGFPGLVLAVLGVAPVHLVERDQRKAAFLREAIRVTGAAATVHAVDVSALRLPLAGAITARALAPLPELLRLAVPLLATEGVLIAPKGKEAQQELTAARAKWNMQAVCAVSLTDPRATILSLRALSPHSAPIPG